ncbi:cAMP/cGMP cyclic nucleotide phosphodiesterase, putative [Pediculus humanus corporis]|uniref:Phosphodiesterase n=1 Tax=Pediculus humanus subsp. corporis TaxID=121224 RepID=E0VBQ2_PEDHC|nr:cAMP/cGMP cyclic nucleotide phosphodiesterase, putative [Pediculus humanus corporis]EEB10808.1 cAMP/cGMP cyclic nucleotide phosphodiesterase, putative [Pediculus humanus corporis]
MVNYCYNRTTVIDMNDIKVNLTEIYLNHPGAFEEWLVSDGNDDLIKRITDIKLKQKKQEGNGGEGGDDGRTRRKKIERNNSVTSELFQVWVSSSSPKKLKSQNGADTRKRNHSIDEGDFFMELIRDVATELDIDVLCHKILINVCLLTYADRGSLFLARGPPDKRYLVAKLFDVTVDTDFDEAIEKVKNEDLKIPFGVGIVGYVAQSKEIINISDAYNDPRFNSEIDMRTGYKTNLILSMPICNYEGDVIGVAQIINKTNGSQEFTQRDVEVFQRYLTFGGIGIQNAQLFELSVQEYKRNQILLHLARSIFEEQSNLECLVTKIMREARDLLKCERCAVYLLDLESCSEENHLEHIIQQPKKKKEEHQPLSRRQSNNINVDDIFKAKESVQVCEFFLVRKPQFVKTITIIFQKIRFSTIFELRADETDAIVLKSKAINSSKLVKIAKYVAANGQILNISDVTTWMNQDVREEEDNFLTKSILCMPISNGQKTLIGVAQLINKTNQQPFTDSDVSIFEAFAIFCGLGIHNTQMYENACKLMAKQKVALECLSYHASASVEDTERLYNDFIPSVESYNLLSFKFIDFKLPDEDTCRATIRMFMECNLIKHFQIPYNVLCRWVLSVKKNYRPVKYHNWRHALNVAQTMFAMLKTGKMERFMTDLEILGLLVACLCHDLDHRGTNNAFQTKTESPLAILYTTSTMEHHHFDQCVMILNSEGNNIFQALSPDDYRQVMKIVENAILSTDLAMYFKKKNRFRELVDDGEFDWQSEEKKEILCGMMMTACDVSAISKPWEVQHKMAKLVADEFFDQGDLEKLQLNQQPVAMMDRERKDELPQMQVGFIDVICLPLYKVMSDTFPWIRPLYEGCLANRNHWQDLAEKVEMGLTWIDHDTIDKPVEEFAVNSDEQPQDIEFTVTTLNCSHSLERQSTVESDNGLQISEAAQRKVSTVGIALGKFASLRKTKGKSMQNRQSRSLYYKTKNSRENSPKRSDVPTSEDDSSTNDHPPISKSKIDTTKNNKRKKFCTLI